ncbi:hypothetical protein HJC23_001399 [Cyclotella cryptica]|uniref:Aminotransferase class V domain-containing protein n=1 Tax=Cyclotella cryptica TaxID=29204 RepID=A0ABD3PCQ2_9STRA|eukprot:CCRYP_016729-RA/>CCRYP_016729-RA protein AED:0.23 eAED:0.23 QI:0/-1/0/1/-1/1/1/0/455
MNSTTTNSIANPNLANETNVKSKCIYLDYNGTTPVHPAVLDAMLPYLTQHFGNPSSSHYYGHEPKRAIDHARRAVLALIRPPPDVHDDNPFDDHHIDLSTIVFTGCGTESNNLAIRLALLSCRQKADEHEFLHVVTTSIEHPAISQCLASYSARHGAEPLLTPRIVVTYVPVNHEGIVSAAEVLGAIRPNTALVTIMTANNEVGSIQPVWEIAAACRERNVLFHTDAAQAVGKRDLRGLAHSSLGADMITIVGHKFGAPKGIAALYIRHGCLNEGSDGSVLLMGGGQEGGRRGGTENVPYIVGMGRAAELLLEKREDSSSTRDVWECNSLWMEQMRDRLLKNIVDGLDNITAVRVNGPSDPKNRLPNTLSIGLRGIQCGSLLANMGNSVACSAGSACHSSSSSGCQYSSILKAMNVPPEFAVGTLRLSVGPDTTEEDVDRAASVIVEEAQRQLGF